VEETSGAPEAIQTPNPQIRRMEVFEIV